MGRTDLFRPDLFSESAPVFSAFDGERSRQLVDQFLHHFGQLGVSVHSIEKSGGIELNSNNFLLRTSKGSYLIKTLRNLDTAAVEGFETQNELMGWLFEAGVPVPIPVKSDNGSYLCPLGDSLWMSVMSFVEGHYFAGASSSVGPVGSAIGKLHASLNESPVRLRPERSLPYFSQLEIDCFNQVIHNTGNALSHFSVEHQGLLNTHHDFLERVWNQVLGYQQDHAQSEHGLVHIDLHPHNVLMNGDTLVAFLDFDSVMRGPYKMMLGFSGFKLLRQVVCAAGGTMARDQRRALVRDYLSNVYSAFPEVRSEPKEIALFSYTELCRRMGLIFKLNLAQNNTDWNHVLGIQINGLLEAEQLFEA